MEIDDRLQNLEERVRRHPHDGNETPQIPGENLLLSDSIVNNVSTSKHGFAPKGTGTGTKFLSDTGSYLSIPNVPTMTLSTLFETSGRFSSLGTAGSGSGSFGTGGLVLQTGSTSSSFAGYTGNIATNVFTAGGIFTGHFNVGPIGNTGSLYFGLGSITVSGSGHTLTDAHIGFRVLIAGGIATLRATCADGSTENFSNLATLSAGDGVDVVCQIVSTSLINFYWRINGGTQSSTTLTTNIPTTSVNTFQASLSNNSTLSNSAATFFGASFQR